MPATPDGQSRNISGCIPEEHFQLAQTLGGRTDTTLGNTSDGLRRLVAFGVEALQGGIAQAQDRLAGQLTGIGPALTPSGATWAALPENLPAAGSVNGPQIIAAPGGVIALGVGPDEMLALDTVAWELVITSQQSEDGTYFELRDLAALASCLPLEINEQLKADAKSVELPLGLVVHSPSRGLIVLSLEDAHVALPLRQALQFAAELSALVARTVARQQDQIGSLERLVAAPAAAEGQEVEA